jgi:acetoin utilization protein AcuB
MLIPPISRYMTRQPWTIRKDAAMSEAHNTMREHHIRHLPVVDAGRLVGLVSERDLHLIETLQDCNPDEIAVDDAMSTDLYVVKPEDPVDEIAENMSQHKYGSAVVVNKRGVVEGIFTTVDALQVLADILRRACA